MKRLVALIIVLAMSLGLVGCVPKAPKRGDGDDVVINVNIVDNGYGMQWLKETKTRFEAEFKDKEYADGKYTGVYLQINETSKTDLVKDFGSSGNHIVFGGGLVRSEADHNTLLNLTADGKNALTGEDKEEYGVNILAESPYEYTGVNAGINSVYDLIRERDKSSFVARDGEIYALPTYEVFAGASYDKNLFDEYGFYFAYHDLESLNEGDISTVPLVCPLLSNVDKKGAVHEDYDNIVYQLVDIEDDEDWKNHKSVGPDGLRGTMDDGLPSSLLELIALCWYMEDKEGVYAVQLQGDLIKEQGYGDTFLHGLVMALLGEEKALTTRTFNGPVDAVVAMTGTVNKDPNDPAKTLTPSIDYIRQPKTKRINVTEETGFYTQWSMERYYTMALYEIFDKNNWFAPGSDPVDGKINHIQAEEQFVFSNYRKPGGGRGEKIAFLSESSYWYNEANIRGPLANFYNYNEEVEDREVRWYSYPSNIANSVTGENKNGTVNGITESLKGEKNVIAQSKLNQVVFNKAAIQKNKDGAVLEAINDFIQFWYSEDELIATTISQGMGRNMNFTIPESSKGEWAGFYRHLNDLKDESYVLPMAANNDTFMLGCRDQFKLGEGGRYFVKYTYELMAGGKSAYKQFIEQMWDPAKWKLNYKGSNMAGVKYLKDEGGNDIIYVKPWDATVL